MKWHFYNKVGFDITYEYKPLRKMSKHRCTHSLILQSCVAERSVVHYLRKPQQSCAQLERQTRWGPNPLFKREGPPLRTTSLVFTVVITHRIIAFFTDVRVLQQSAQFAIFKAFLCCYDQLLLWPFFCIPTEAIYDFVFIYIIAHLQALKQGPFHQPAFETLKKQD